MLKLWENPMLSMEDRLGAAAGEIKRLRGEAAAADELRERMADILNRTAIALHGPEPALMRWSWHDLPERVATLMCVGAGELRLVSIAPDGSTCTLNVRGEEVYYDRTGG